jgi:proline iminopeptidase
VLARRGPGRPPGPDPGRRVAPTHKPAAKGRGARLGPPERPSGEAPTAASVTKDPPQWRRNPPPATRGRRAGRQPARARRWCSCTAAPAAASIPCYRRYFDPAKWRIVLLRPARLRQEPAVRRTAREHHLGPGRRHREAARASSASSAGWCSAAAGAARWRWPTPRRTRAGQGAHAARHLHAAAQRAAVVLPGGRQPHLPRRLGEVPRAPIPARTRRPDAAYYKRLTSRDRAVRKEAREGVERSGRGTRASSITDPALVKRLRRRALRRRVRAHRSALLRQPRLLRARRPAAAQRGQRRLRKIPAVIVQGRYDVVCPAKSAWDLKRAVPHAELKLHPRRRPRLERAGHRGARSSTPPIASRSADRGARDTAPRRPATRSPRPRSPSP